jgi:hypothetical protein
MRAQGTDLSQASANLCVCVMAQVLILRKLRGTLNVVHLACVYEDESHVHIIMEYCRGGELFHKMGRRHYSERTVSEGAGSASAAASLETRDEPGMLRCCFPVQFAVSGCEGTYCVGMGCLLSTYWGHAMQDVHSTDVGCVLLGEGPSVGAVWSAPRMNQALCLMGV